MYVTSDETKELKMNFTILNFDEMMAVLRNTELSNEEVIKILMLAGMSRAFVLDMIRQVR